MTMKSPILIPKSSVEIPSQKFILYLKVKEISAVNQALTGALKLPLNEQREWADLNGVILDEALNTFIDDSNVILERMSMDDEILELSEKLVTGLKNASKNLDSLLIPQDELES